MSCTPASLAARWQGPVPRFSDSCSLWGKWLILLCNVCAGIGHAGQESLTLWPLNSLVRYDFFKKCLSPKTKPKQKAETKTLFLVCSQFHFKALLLSPQTQRMLWKILLLGCFSCTPGATGCLFFSKISKLKLNPQCGSVGK